MAQIAANPRITDETLLEYADDLLEDAIRLSYPEFEALARRWESLADPIGQAEKSERLHATRRAHLVRKPGGGWALNAHFDDIGGEEFNNVLNHFTAAETEHDLARAVEDSDDTSSTLKLRRTEAQRRADALLNMAAAAAACPPAAVRPVPVLNLLGDIETVQAAFNDVPIAPSRYRDVTCRTNTGRCPRPLRGRQADLLGRGPTSHRRRPRRGDRPRATTTMFHRRRPRSGQAHIPRMRLARMRRPTLPMSDRSRPELGVAWTNQPGQRRMRLRLAQPAEGTGLQGAPRHRRHLAVLPPRRPRNPLNDSLHRLPSHDVRRAGGGAVL